MNDRRNKWISGIGAAAVAMLGSVVCVSTAGAFRGAEAMVWSAEEDVIIFRSGKQVTGKILEETPTTVKVLVKMGGLSAEAVYQKDEILSIKRGEGGEAKPEGAPSGSEGSKAGVKKPVSKAIVAGDEGEAAPTLYVIPMRGEFGRNVSHTPVERILAEAKKLQPDILVLDLDHEFSFMGQERQEFNPADAGAAFNQLETARELSTLLTDYIRDDSEWEKKPRVVAWVKKALGGAAFLPFVCPEIYFASDGRHGNIGYLEFIFKGVGDEVAQEKQYSLRLDRAEGLAIKGGHPYQIIKGMARADYVLSVSFEGGRPVYHERMPRDASEILLTDDASEEENRRDTVEDVIRFRGNDVITLDAALAERLGLSRGTADTIDELTHRMGISRGYVVLETKAESILKEWGESVTRAERDFVRLWEDYGRVQVEAPGDYDARTKFRGTRIRILKQIKSLLDRYKEAINPQKIQGAPLDWDININLLIEQLQQQQRMDRR